MSLPNCCLLFPLLICFVYSVGAFSAHAYLSCRREFGLRPPFLVHCIVFFCHIFFCFTFRATADAHCCDAPVVTSLLCCCFCCWCRCYWLCVSLWNENPVRRISWFDCLCCAFAQTFFLPSFASTSCFSCSTGVGSVKETDH